MVSHSFVICFMLLTVQNRGRDSSVATGWTVRGAYSGGDDIIRTRPDRPWGPPNLLYSAYRIIPGGKAAGAWHYPPTRI